MIQLLGVPLAAAGRRLAVDDARLLGHVVKHLLAEGLSRTMVVMHETRADTEANFVQRDKGLKNPEAEPVPGQGQPGQGLPGSEAVAPLGAKPSKKARQRARERERKQEEERLEGESLMHGPSPPDLDPVAAPHHSTSDMFPELEQSTHHAADVGVASRRVSGTSDKAVGATSFAAVAARQLSPVLCGLEVDLVAGRKQATNAAESILSEHFSLGAARHPMSNRGGSDQHPVALPRFAELAHDGGGLGLSPTWVAGSGGHVLGNATTAAASWAQKAGGGGAAARE